ncbi:MAG: flagellar biosynthesis protein FlhA [Pseudomonadota bacterium]
MPRLGGAGKLGDWLDYARRADILLAVGVMTILVILIMPLPAMLLDVFLAISIILSVMVLMTALFIQGPLEFSAFPTVLLIATMLRLSLNLASTRLILSEGHNGTSAAGNVIEAFGNFVMRGNFVIGIIVFAILVIVNFVVITKGSGRIAEVAARFTLDAMPGKQMAIDADLSAGLISDDEAKGRRKKLEDESSFFGAMDGASKFVRGDAIAGILITFINVIGGIIIGVGQMGMSFSDAASNYTLLTVGDGLVSQIPALVVSTAAGLLVSKAGVTGAADKALVAQLSGYPKALGLSAAVMVIMAMLPGMPTLVFLALGAVAGYFAWTLTRSQEKAKIEAQAASVAEAAAAGADEAEEPIEQALKIDELRLELGFALVQLINENEHDNEAIGNLLTDQIKALRRQLATEMGFLMPSVRLQDNIQLSGNDYVIRVKEVEAGRGTVYPRQFMVMDPSGGNISMPGQATVEPTFGLPVKWVDGKYRSQAEDSGYTVVDPATVISTHLTETIKNNIADLLSYAHVQKLLKELPADHQKLVEDLVPTQITVSGIQRVLQILLTERISIRDLSTILEGIAEASSFARTPSAIAEHVRSRLGRQICASHMAPGGYLPVLNLTGAWEVAFAESLIGEGDDRQLAMAPSKLQEFVPAVTQGFEDAAAIGEVPVVLTSPMIRPYVRSIVERFRTHTVVMSQAEIHPSIKLKTVGTI